MKLTTFRILFALFIMFAISEVTLAKSDEVAFVTPHKSVFNKINYKIPKGWVVVDGESDWIAPRTEKYFWKPEFDPKTDAYYVVSTIFPHLTMMDMKTKNTRTFAELVNATRHALIVAAGAVERKKTRFYTIGSHASAEIQMRLKDGSILHQIFIQLNSDEIAIVAGCGPVEQYVKMKTIVAGIAATIKSAKY